MKKILIFIILSVIILISIGRYFFPAISLKNPTEHELYLVENKKLIIEDGKNIRNFLFIGDYYIYYQKNEFNRFYAKVILKPWNNVLTPDFKLYSLPARQYQLAFGKDMSFSHKDEFKYIGPGGKDQKLEIKYDISVRYDYKPGDKQASIHYKVDCLNETSKFSEKVVFKDGLKMIDKNYKYTLNDYKIFRLYLKARINHGLLYLTPSLEYK